MLLEKNVNYEGGSIIIIMQEIILIKLIMGTSKFGFLWLSMFSSTNKKARPSGWAYENFNQK